MHYEYVIKLLSDLKLDSKNSRTHSEAQIEQIAESIRVFRFTNPLLIDEKDELIAGEGRYKGALKAGLEEVPCIIVAGLTKAQRRALVIADNKLALNAGWNEELLAEEIQELIGQDFDVDVLGFSGDEIEELIGDQVDAEIDEVDSAPLPAFCRAGDVWILDGHKLTCGQNLKESDSIIRWWQQYSGKKATLQATGEFFDDVQPMNS